MWSWRVIGALAGSMFINLNMTTCRSPGESESGQAPKSEPVDVSLPGVDTSELTAREKRQWSEHVTELLAPCKNETSNIATCVQEKRACSSCLPAARYIASEVRKGRTKGQVDSAFRARFSPDEVKSIDLSGSPSKGATNAPVVIVEWADFECPACRVASPALDDLVKERGDEVRLVFKNYPLDIHPNAETAARAAMAADKQGKFWEMHHALFSTDPPLTRATIDALAEKIGLDMKQFAADLDSEPVADAVARDRKQGEDVKLRATPTIYINGREFRYGEDLSAELDEWIDLELELVGKERKKSAAPKPPASAAPPASSGSAEKSPGAAKSPAPAPSEKAPAEKAPAEKPPATEKPASPAAPAKP